MGNCGFWGASLRGQVRVVASEGGPPRNAAATNEPLAGGDVGCAQYRRDLVVIRTAADALWARYQWRFASLRYKKGEEQTKRIVGVLS
jgi:hypothetical protein